MVASNSFLFDFSSHASVLQQLAYCSSLSFLSLHPCLLACLLSTVHTRACVCLFVVIAGLFLVFAKPQRDLLIHKEFPRFRFLLVRTPPFCSRTQINHSQPHKNSHRKRIQKMLPFPCPIQPPPFSPFPPPSPELPLCVTRWTPSALLVALSLSRPPSLPPSLLPFLLLPLLLLLVLFVLSLLVSIPVSLLFSLSHTCSSWSPASSSSSFSSFSSFVCLYIFLVLPHGLSLLLLLLVKSLTKKSSF